MARYVYASRIVRLVSLQDPVRLAESAVRIAGAAPSHHHHRDCGLCLAVARQEVLVNFRVNCAVSPLFTLSLHKVVSISPPSKRPI